MKNNTKEDKIKQLQEEIDQLRWELFNGAYKGCSDASINAVYNKLYDLEDEVYELTININD